MEVLQNDFIAITLFAKTPEIKIKPKTTKAIPEYFSSYKEKTIEIII